MQRWYLFYERCRGIFAHVFAVNIAGRWRPTADTCACRSRWLATVWLSCSLCARSSQISTLYCVTVSASVDESTSCNTPACRTQPTTHLSGNTPAARLIQLQTDRQTDRDWRMDRQTDRWTDRETETDGWTDNQTDGQTDRQRDRDW